MTTTEYLHDDNLTTKTAESIDVMMLLDERRDDESDLSPSCDDDETFDTVTALRDGKKRFILFLFYI